MNPVPSFNRATARRIVLSSALVGALSSFSMNAVVPALPEIQAYFSATVAQTQIIISAGLLALALGNLLIAPLSDRIGRKPIVVAGLAVFSVANVVAAVAPDIRVVIAARIVQAFGIGAGTAVARAAINDYFGPERAATGIALTAMAILFVPLVAPTVGGFATEWFGWRTPLALTAVFGLGAGLYILLGTESTQPPGPTPGERPPGMLQSYATLLGDPGFRAFALYGSFLLCAIYTFVTGAPYVARQLMQLSASDYGLWAALPAAASLCGFATAARISRRVGASAMLAAGTGLALLGGFWMLIAAGLHVRHPLALFAPAMLISFAQSISLPNAMAGALGLRPKLAGAASGLMGFLQLALAAIWAQGVGAAANGTSGPLGIAICAATMLAALCWLRLRALTEIRTG